MAIKKIPLKQKFDPVSYKGKISKEWTLICFCLQDNQGFALGNMQSSKLRHLSSDKIITVVTIVANNNKDYCISLWIKIR